jgi:hypothetical protein
VIDLYETDQDFCGIIHKHNPMKKTLLFTSLMCLLDFTGYTQIVVERSDLPVIGDLVVTANDEVTVLNPGNPGMNQTWDFSNLVASSYDSAVFIPVNLAPYYENYPLANMAGHSVNMQSGYSYGFYHDAGNDIGIAGIDVQAVIMPGFFMNIHLEYLDAAYFHLPYHYGDTHTSTYVEEGYSAMYNNGVQLDTSRTITHVTSQLLVDASGTMITPTGSFQVLRVKEIQTWIDSSFVLNGGIWVFESAEPRSNLSYAWFGKNYGLIGKMFMDDGRATGMSFFVSETFVNVNSPELIKIISLSPNPVSTDLTIKSSKDIKKVEIYDLGGSLKMVSSNLKQVNVSKLESGAYIIKVITSEGVTSAKFIKQ